MKKTVLIPLPANDFDPTEAAVPWKVLSDNNTQIVFATPLGTKASCDQRMLTGSGLGIFAPLLQADKRGQQAFLQMSTSAEYMSPIKWQDINVNHYDGLILPGGHAQGMREYLESQILQNAVGKFFLENKLVGAICHGVVLAARSKMTNGKSVLFGKKTTALLASQELLAWSITNLWLGDYYRTYPITVEEEVRSLLAHETDFVKGPIPIFRDEPNRLDRGFCLQDGNYISARWPGDAHNFANEFLRLLY